MSVSQFSDTAAIGREASEQEEAREPRASAKAGADDDGTRRGHRVGPAMPFFCP